MEGAQNYLVGESARAQGTVILQGLRRVDGFYHAVWRGSGE